MKNEGLLLIIFLLTFSYFGILALSGSQPDIYADATVRRVPTDFANITAALANCSDGDTILVESGMLAESMIEVNKTVHILGIDRESAIVDGGGTTGFIFKVSANSVVVENLTLQNASLTSFDAIAVRLYNVTNVAVKNTIIKNVYNGIQLTRSNFTQIMYSKVFNNTYGIYIKDSSLNSTIVGNTFEDNQARAIQIDATCSFSKMYHNNFVNNSVYHMATTYFDDGYPSGGNFWSDHVASDLYSGHGQNEVGSDGILDVGYPSYSPWDEYPLAHPFAKVDVVADGGSFEVLVSTNATLDSHYLNVTAKALTLFLTGVEGSNGSCRVSIPKELLSCEFLDNWTVVCDGVRASYLKPYDDQNFTYLYFTYVQSASSKVEIEGTRVIPEFSLLALVIVFLAASSAIVLLLRNKG